MLLLFSTICRGTQIRERTHNSDSKTGMVEPRPRGLQSKRVYWPTRSTTLSLDPTPIFWLREQKTRLDYDPGHSCSVRELNVFNTSPPKKLGRGINSEGRSHFYVFLSPRTNCQGNIQLDRFFPTSTLKFSSEIAALSVWNCIQLLMLKPSERASCHEDSRLE